MSLYMFAWYIFYSRNRITPTSLPTIIVTSRGHLPNTKMHRPMTGNKHLLTVKNRIVKRTSSQSRDQSRWSTVKALAASSLMTVPRPHSSKLMMTSPLMAATEAVASASLCLRWWRWLSSPWLCSSQAYPWWSITSDATKMDRELLIFLVKSWATPTRPLTTIWLLERDRTVNCKLVRHYWKLISKALAIIFRTLASRHFCTKCNMTVWNACVVQITCHIIF